MSFIIPNWPAPKNVKSISSTREGGVSLAPYNGLNVGMHVGDDEQLVTQNRAQLQVLSNMPSAPVWLNQTHSTDVVQVNVPTTNVLNADGCITGTANVVCSAMTADCLPILLTDLKGTQVAAVHAGWRGLADGIIENAVAKFDSEVMAWIGPAIGANAFEVGQDVFNAFTSQIAQASLAFKVQPNNTTDQPKWLADMPLLVTQRLQRAGVTQIFSSDLCTYNDPQRFFSYRRDGVTGRQASFIWIE